MTTNNSLTVNNFSLLTRPLRGSLFSNRLVRLFEIIRSSDSYGYENKKEIRSDYQAVILINQPSS